MVGESALMTFSSSGRSLARAHQPAVRNVIPTKTQAPGEVQPERRVEVLLIEVLPLDDRGSEPLLHEPVDERDVHDGHRHDAEVAWPEDRSEHEREDRGQARADPSSSRRPRRAGVVASGPAHRLPGMRVSPPSSAVGRRPRRCGAYPRARSRRALQTADPGRVPRARKRSWPRRHERRPRARAARARARRLHGRPVLAQRASPYR